ncbi:MAG TPA: hypothetical protein VII92_09370 [Anaerolineae bacterium]
MKSGRLIGVTRMGEKLILGDGSIIQYRRRHELIEKATVPA